MKPPKHSIPPAIPSALTIFALVAVWGGARLLVASELILPLTYVVPMLATLWTRRTWHIWTMAVLFAGCAALEVFWLFPQDEMPQRDLAIVFATTVFNICAGAVVMQLMLGLRLRLDDRSARLLEHNVELEAQAEELAQQNEEIRVQAEELAQQNEEIEAQSEEFAGQNEEIQAANERLRLREEILQNLLESTRTPESSLEVLRDTCRRALHAVGAPAACVSVLRIDPDMIRVKVQASDECGLTIPDEWPLIGTIAQVVIEQKRTAYVSDLEKQPELAAPFGTQARIRSILATPMLVGGKIYGVVIACSGSEAHWTQEQFSVIEWVSAQCGLITESIRWQKALQQRTQELEAALHAKDHFLAMLSHELRTPLTPVLAAAGVLEHDARVPADVREDLRMIRRNVSIQSRLVDDLLDLARLSRGKLDLELQVLDLANLLRETATIVAPDIDARDQSLELEIAAAEGRNVHGDGARLQQVFWNLLKNAVKFSPAKARITLRARVLGGDVERLAVDVIDGGVGIAAADIERIFKPFEQVAPAGKLRSGDGGLGLGLAIAKAIVELHHGTIDVHSDGLGCGAMFTVELPLVASSGAAKDLSPAPVTPKPSDEKSLSLLLVEDHVDTGRILARLLRNAGYAVEHAETAGAAFGLFSSRHFDIVISDLGLPDQSGLDLMKRMREVRPNVVGICLSGYGMEDDLTACREAGFAEHLTKPVDMMRLRAAIRRIASKEA